MPNLNVNEIYLDCTDEISPAENGYFSVARFNRFSWIGQLNLIDWLSGDVSAIVPPQPYLSQKNKDWLAHLIVKKLGQVNNGVFPQPVDYYQWDNGFILGNKTDADCEDDVVPNAGCNTPLELLDGQQFYERCNTFIEELKPENKPICKMVAGNFEFLPTDIGSIGIEYIKYPRKAFLGVTLDPVYNEEVYNPSTSIDFEWPEFARPILKWFIVNAFADSTREAALKQTNIITGKTVRDGKS